MLIDKYVPIACAAQKGGQRIMEYFRTACAVKTKSCAADYQTEADMAAEQAILEILSLHYPNYNIFSEEAGSIDKGSPYTFVIDPLDGTNNFVLGIPYFSVSIGLMKGDEVMVGVVYNPVTGITYVAEKGMGAWMYAGIGGTLMKASLVSSMEQATVSIVLSYADKREGLEERITRDLYRKGVKRVTFYWSTVMDFCLLAEGRMEAIIFSGPPLYDHAAGKLIAREAGAIVSDLQGKPELNDKNNAFVVANHSNIHSEILSTLDNAG